VEQQGGIQEFRRDKALEALAILSMNESGFLSEIRDDLESTLWRYGFALSPQEMWEARHYLTQTAELTDEEILQRLESHEGPRW
jgi:hypothetical protein